MPNIDTSTGRIPSTSTPTQNVKIGRVSLPYQPVASTSSSKTPSRPYALTKPSLIVLEKLAACLSLAEPVLMVGETGTGKTAAVGYLAEMMGRRLTAINLSNQTESGDLVGGFRPIDEAEEARRMFLFPHLLSVRTIFGTDFGFVSLFLSFQDPLPNSSIISSISLDKPSRFLETPSSSLPSRKPLRRSVTLDWSDFGGKRRGWRVID